MEENLILLLDQPTGWRTLLLGTQVQSPKLISCLLHRISVSKGWVALVHHRHLPTLGIMQTFMVTIDRRQIKLFRLQSKNKWLARSRKEQEATGSRLKSNKIQSFKSTITSSMDNNRLRNKVSTKIIETFTEGQHLRLEIRELWRVQAIRF